MFSHRLKLNVFGVFVIASIEDRVVTHHEVSTDTMATMKAPFSRWSPKARSSEYQSKFMTRELATNGQRGKTLVAGNDGGQLESVPCNDNNALSHVQTILRLTH